MVAAIPTELPARLGFIAGLVRAWRDEPPQSLKEYDPEWGRAFWSGSFYASCPHEQMLASVKVPVLFTHHFRMVDEASGALMGAISDLQVGARPRARHRRRQRLRVRLVPGDGPLDARAGPAALRRHAVRMGPRSASLTPDPTGAQRSAATRSCLGALMMQNKP